jgi:hypothetical protein
MLQSPPQPDVSLVGASLIMQVALVLILASATWILHQGERKASEDNIGVWRLSGRITTAIILMIAITFVPLFAASDFGPVWTKMFANLRVFSISTSKALTWMFCVDIVIIARLISWTGGSKDSVFSPALGILPALAIFLHEPFKWVMIYSACVFLALWITYRAEYTGVAVYNYARARSIQTGNLFVNGASIALTTLLGFVTQK